KTSDRWGPSCFFAGQDIATPADDSECAQSIMAKPWSVVDAKQRYIEVGPLKTREHLSLSEAGLVNFDMPRGMNLEFDHSAEPRFTWEGKSPRPLIAVPAGTKMMRVPGKPIRLLNQQTKTELIKHYTREARVMYTCRDKPEHKVHQRPAKRTDIVVTPLREY